MNAFLKNARRTKWIIHRERKMNSKPSPLILIALLSLAASIPVRAQSTAPAPPPVAAPAPIAPPNVLRIPAVPAIPQLPVLPPIVMDRLAEDSPIKVIVIGEDGFSSQINIDPTNALAFALPNLLRLDELTLSLDGQSDSTKTKNKAKAKAKEKDQDDDSDAEDGSTTGTKPAKTAKKPASIVKTISTMQAPTPSTKPIGIGPATNFSKWRT